MKRSVLSTLTLVCICAVMAALLAVTNAITSPIIKENQDKNANQALLEVMPSGKGFEKMDVSSYTLPDSVTEVYKEEGGGYVIMLTVTGYQAGMTVMCGVNADGTVSGAKCLSSAETLGYEKTYGENFAGKDAAGVDALATVSGATKTTAAYKSAVKDALSAAVILGGGSVDLRTEEEILLDNLSEALPAGEEKFTKLFITEVIEGIDAVYVADNGAGSVYVIGEEFIAVTADGTVGNATVAAAHAILSASTSSDLDLGAFEGLPKALISAKKTETGNYILELKASGYGINGGNKYHPASGQHILIRVALTPSGKIIDTLTVSHGESENFGDACADEKFYGQFDGKTEENYRDIDAISGATMTTNGYLNAIKGAFECVRILEGGASNEE